MDSDQLATDAVTVSKLDADNSPSDGQVPAYVDASGRMAWVDQTGGGAGDISQVIAGNGLSGGGDTGTVTLNVDVGEASFPTVPIVHGGTAGTSQSEAWFGLGISDVFDAAAWDGTARSIVYGRLGGGAHEVLLEVEEFHGLGGDTFTVERGFDFGDSAIVDEIYYISTFRTEQLVSPTTIVGAANFANIPVLNSGGQLLTTFLATGGTDNQVLTRTGTGMAWEDTAAVITTFLGLSDTPSAFGSALQSVRVNTGGTAFEFYTPPTPTSTFLGLSDTPSAFGYVGQAVRTATGGVSLEFYTPTSGGATTFLGPD